MSTKRGLVISPPIVVTPNGLSGGGPLDPQEVRSYLLFWDKLDWPTNNLIYIGGGPDAEFLCAAGILNRTHVTLRSGAGGPWFYDAHIAAYRQLEAEEPGIWSLARGQRSISFPEHELQEGRGVLFELHRAVPVPDKDVPYSDILEFREKRKSELVALRTHLEEVFQRIMASPDVPLAALTEIERLRRDLENYIKACQETKFPFRLSDLKAKIDVGDLLAKVVGGAIVGSQVGQPTIGALLGGAASLFKCEASFGLRDKRLSSTPFEYVAAYHARVF